MSIKKPQPRQILPSKPPENDRDIAQPVMKLPKWTAGVPWVKQNGAIAPDKYEARKPVKRRSA
jgi:hypothetical protein